MALTRRIAVRRASILDILLSGKFFLTSVSLDLGESFPIVTSDLRVSRTSITIRIDVPRAGCSLNQSPTSIFRRPPSDVSTPLKFFFPLRGPLLVISADICFGNLRFRIPASDNGTSWYSDFSFFPLRGLIITTKP
ncbi:hypothetical protein R3P38DRAFT_3561640 [Favolaschia claudopus]|uniref:Uncharacterized protein n=1 Tax=Favolaschia claudopus TaxID=2862362 RepID=A0AAW0AZ25_9AGAR